MAYEVTMRFTELVGLAGGAIRVNIVDTGTGREVTNQTYINRPISTPENIKQEIIYAANRLCGWPEVNKKPERKKAPAKEKNVATTTVTKEVKK